MFKIPGAGNRISVNQISGGCMLAFRNYDIWQYKDPVDGIYRDPDEKFRIFLELICTRAV